MPISNEEKELFLSHKGQPIVGLIHKENNTIVFAPCIPQKVRLQLDENGNAISGTLMRDNLENMTATNDNDNDESLDLNYINSLLKQNYVPRIVDMLHDATSDVKSAHEFLFEQKCGLTNKSEWGGFALTLNALNELEYEFSSGAFNSGASSKRIQGAQLSSELIKQVIKETAVLGTPKLETNDATSPWETPPKNRKRSYRLFSSDSISTEQTTELQSSFGS